MMTITTGDSESGVCGVETDRIFTINYLYVSPENRRHGVATRLLQKLGRWCLVNGIRRIDLDDMSDNHRMKNNIYKKNGFVYRNKDCGCEMYGTPATLTRLTERNIQAQNTSNRRFSNVSV